MEIANITGNLRFEKGDIIFLTGDKIDKLYVINKGKVKISTLRDRRKDILPLVNQFKREFEGSFKLSLAAEELLLSYNWKGNVRELKNYIEYLVSLEIKEVDIKDFPFEIDEALKEEVIDKEIKYEIYDKATEELMQNFVEYAGKNLFKYIFILEELEKAFLQNKRLGRRSILSIAKQNNIFLGEQEIRNMFIDLENHNIVEIFKGRGGTVITEYGKNILKYLKRV